MKHFSLPQDGGLIEKGLSGDIIHIYEKIPTEAFDDPMSASEEIADEIIKAIKKTPKGKHFMLGLTTGNSPAQLYTILRKRYEEGKVSFKNVEVFSIDEYYPVSKNQKQSRNYRIHAELLNHIDIDKKNIHIPDGTVPQDKITEFCQKFDKKASNLDLVVIGFGPGGQVGFNDKGSNFQSRTRMVMLPFESRKLQSKNFNNDYSVTPKAALTMGLGTFMSAKRVILMAWGDYKSDAVKQIVEGEADINCPATVFQSHNNVSMYVDTAAGSGLTRFFAPWLIGPCNWTPKFRRKAVLWLCKKVEKPVLKLSYQDYLQNSLEELVEKFGPYDSLNVQIFKDLQSIVTGHPAGFSDKFRKNVIVFSPHPDDDIISMGGTLIRLAHTGHNVHVAYQTSGNAAVLDDVVIQHFDAAAQIGLGDRRDEVAKLVASKKPGDAEPRKLLDIKAAVRRSEARGACRSFGLPMENVHFLNLPFYETGKEAKNPCTQADIDITKEFIKKVKPNQIYMAGDLADPHGTHRICTESAMAALEQLREEKNPEYASWLDTCEIWLYRGAWMEWSLSVADMAVPLSPEEVIEKRHAIYHHLSQKDIVPFPGEDSREFWQRAEDRNHNTAVIYDKLGMSEYQAMEVFVKL